MALVPLQRPAEFRQVLPRKRPAQADTERAGQRAGIELRQRLLSQLLQCRHRPEITVFVCLLEILNQRVCLRQHVLLPSGKRQLVKRAGRIGRAEAQIIPLGHGLQFLVELPEIHASHIETRDGHSVPFQRTAEIPDAPPERRELPGGAADDKVQPRIPGFPEGIVDAPVQAASPHSVQPLGEGQICGRVASGTGTGVQEKPEAIVGAAAIRPGAGHLTVARLLPDLKALVHPHIKVHIAVFPGMGQSIPQAFHQLSKLHGIDGLDDVVCNLKFNAPLGIAKLRVS